MEARRLARAPGLAGAVVDNSPLELTAIEPGDRRRPSVKVAGYGALLVAKLHKLGDRLATLAASSKGHG